MAQPINLQDYAYYQVWWRINRLILRQLEFSKLVQEIVDAIFEELDAQQLGYVLVDLLIPDYANGILKTAAISRTRQAQEMMSRLPQPYFEKNTIPFDDPVNICVKAFKDGKKYVTQTWSEVLSPIVTKEEAEKIQMQVGVKTVLVYPLASSKILGVIIFNLSKNDSEIDGNERMLLEGISDAATVALENSYMYSKLQELDRLKDEFLSLAAHELRTPMTAIKGYSYELTKETNLNPKAKEYLDRVYKSTERLVNLVNDMLDVSRIESDRVELHPDKIDVVKTVTDVMTDLAGKAAEKNLKMNFTPLGQTAFTGFCDQDKLIQILTNLIGNAIKFTPDGGAVTVSLQMVNGFIETKVSDTGVGIDPEDIPKLFGKFVRVKTSTGIPGTGLGLYLSKRLVNLMGGEMQAKSDGAGHGTTFSFTIKSG